MEQKIPKLTKQQIKLLQVQLHFIFEEKGLFRQCLDMLAEVYAEADIGWHGCYEQDPIKLLILSSMALGIPKEAGQNGTLEDFFAIAEQTSEVDLDEWDKKRDPRISRIDACRIFLAQSYDLECLGRYGVHMHDLLRRIKDGNDKALFNLIDIDSTAIGCKIVQRRLQKATLKQDSAFVTKLTNKLKKASSVQHELHRKQMRILIRALWEQDQLNDYSNPALHDLFVEFGVVSRSDNLDNTKTLKYGLLKELRQ